MGKGLNATMESQMGAITNEPIFLYQIQLDPTTYRRFAGEQTTDIIFNGFTWKAAAIIHNEVDCGQDSRVDEVTISVGAVSSELLTVISVGSASINGYIVTIYRVFRGLTDDPTNYEIVFQGEIDGGSSDGDVLSIHVKRGNASFAKIIPGETYSALCPLGFKDSVCQYAGTDVLCSRTPQDCTAKGNMINFAGFPWVALVKNFQY